MKTDELGEDANLYFESYAVIQYVLNELGPQAEAEVETKLTAARTNIAARIATAGFKTSQEDDGRLGAYVSDAWLNHATADVGVFLRLRGDFKNTSVPSRLGVTAHLHDQARKVVKAAKTDDAAWLSELSEAHGKQLSDQLYRDIDWYDEFETFDEMAEKIAAELIALLEGLRDLLNDKGVTP